MMHVSLQPTSSQSSALLCLQVNIKTRAKFMWICTFFCALEIAGFGCRISVMKQPGYAGYVSMQGENTVQSLVMHSFLVSVCKPAPEYCLCTSVNAE